jgi:hypothetical protein
MTETDDATDPSNTTVILAHLEAMLDEAVAAAEAFHRENPDADVDEVTEIVDVIIERIEAIEPQTLGHLRIRAKTALVASKVNADPGIIELLHWLEQLPERLWNERLGP